MTIAKVSQSIKDKDLKSLSFYLNQMSIKELNKSYQRYGPQEIYPDLETYQLIHLGIASKDIEIVKLILNFPIYAKSIYTIDSNFNSKADQYLNQENYNIIQYSIKNGTPTITQYIKDWLKEN